MKIIFKQIFILIVLSLIILAGIVADIYVKNGFYFLVVKDLQSIIETLIAIHATIATLSLTVLTILCSFVDKSYLGVSISDYYSNKKYPWFKNFIVILVSLALIIIDLFLLFFYCYNTIIFIFIANMILILIAINNVCYVFKGKNKRKQDIGNYVENVFFSKNLNKQLELFDSFCDEWKTTVLFQSDAEIEYYKGKFTNYLFTLLQVCNENSIKDICANVKVIGQNLLIDSRTEKKQQGIKFFTEIYSLLRYFLCKDDIDKQKFADFALISEVIDNFLDALRAIPKNWIENNFNWHLFIGNIDTIAIFINAKSKTAELNSSLRIASQMGKL